MHFRPLKSIVLRPVLEAKESFVPDPVLFSRRELLAASAALALAPALSSFPSLALAATEPLAKPLDRAQRWIQLALVEKDPATFDLDWWLDFFKRTSAQGA